jgi:hypothetical protein
MNTIIVIGLNFPKRSFGTPLVVILLAWLPWITPIPPSFMYQTGKYTNMTQALSVRRTSSTTASVHAIGFPAKVVMPCAARTDGLAESQKPRRQIRPFVRLSAALRIRKKECSSLDCGG